MAKLKELAIKVAGDQFLFDPEHIHEEDGTNYRDMESEGTQAHIRKMANAIHEGGTSKFPAITVYQKDGKVYVRAGWCRRRAHILARNEGAPVLGIRVISSEMKDPAEGVLDVLNSNDNFPLTPIEIARAIYQLTTFDWDVPKIAKRRGVSVTTISNYLALLDAPAEVKQMVASGEVSATLAVNTVRKEGALLAGDVLKTAVQTAKDSGKAKATAKHVAPVVAKVDWKDRAGTLQNALAGIVHAPGHAAQQIAIDHAATILEGLRG